MKKIILVVSLLFLFVGNGWAGDWNTENSDIYYNGGNVGIGIDNPGANLHIKSDSSFGRLIIEGAGNGHTQGDILLKTGITYSPSSRGTGIYTYNEGTKSTWYFGNPYKVSDMFVINRYNNGTSFNVQTAAYNKSDNFFSIKNNGNVGIGTVIPGKNLEIGAGSGHQKLGLMAGASSVAKIDFGDSDDDDIGSIRYDNVSNSMTLITNASDRVTITKTGYVGIGTTSPKKNLEIGKGSGHLKLGLKAGTSSIAIIDFGDSNDDNIGSIRYDNAGNSMALTTNAAERMRIDSTGNIGIGTASPQNKLDVNGTIRAKEVKVETGWADYVFEDDYKLQPLSEIESFVKENKHLPEVPSAAEIKEDGLSMASMMELQMKKIEELTLHLIEQNKQNELQNKIIEDLQNELALLKK